ncbi:MAG: hypothetical protein JXA42_08925, partial [Anaerolineales bacterium]|nr:hypothetical protein [Anaerolineales bacterium]
AEDFTVTMLDSLTYTVQIIDPDDRAVGFLDLVPTHTTYISNSLLAPEGIDYNPASGVISGTLNLTAGAPVTISYSVNTDYRGVPDSTLIKNRACVHPVGSGLEDCQWSNEVTNLFEVWTLFIPILY